MSDRIKQEAARGHARVAALGTVLMGMILGGVALAGPASATVDPVETAFSDMEAKVTTYGTAIVALVIVSAVIFLGIKFLRKGLSKA